LNGRDLWIAATERWSEFLIDLLAFCRALESAGARARVLCDRPLAVIADEVRAGRRWQPPMFGVRQKPADWDDDVLGRLRARDLLRFAAPDDWPGDVEGAAVFRFGYVECFTPETLARFQRWEARGAAFLNPPTFYLDSKAVLAAAALPIVRARVFARAPEALATLDRCLPETVLLQAAVVERLMDEQSDWVLKFAGFDNGEAAWGGRSLQIGPALSRREWAGVLRRYLALPWPVVAQRLTPTAQVDVEYVDARGQVQALHGGFTRLRTFFARAADGAAPLPCGAHLTVSSQGRQVSEASDAVQAPVVFAGRYNPEAPPDL
jgi:hypothetical protein